MIRNETFVYWNRNTRTMYFTNELGFTGLVYEIPGIRKRPSKKFMVEKLKQSKNPDSKNYIYYTCTRDYLRGADSEFVEKKLEKLAGNSDILWWRIEL